jgi:hypothetical protein
MKRSRFTYFGIERPFPWLLIGITSAEVVAATAVCLAAITGVLYVAHCHLPADLHDIF